MEETAPEEETTAEIDDGPFETDVKKPASPEIGDREKKEENPEDLEGAQDEEEEKKVEKKRVRKSKRKEPAKEEIDAAVDLMVHGVPPEDFDPVTLQYCIGELMGLKRQSVVAKNYVEADFYAQLIKTARRAVDISNFSAQCSQRLGDLIEKRADAQDNHDAAVDMWHGLFEEFEQTVDAKFKSLSDQQSKELEEFDGSRPEGLPLGYLKHSMQYLLLRQRETRLLALEEFLMADAVRQQADRLEKQELSNQHVKLQDDMERRRNILIEKHTQQFEVFAVWLNSRRHELLRKREVELSALDKRLKHYSALVERIEKKGLPPNPNTGFTTTRVSRKEGVKAVRAAAQTQLEKEAARRQGGDKKSVTALRPTSAVMIMNSPVLKGVQYDEPEASN
jgi:hypothetical protein